MHSVGFRASFELSGESGEVCDRLESPEEFIGSRLVGLAIEPERIEVGLGERSIGARRFREF